MAHLRELLIGCQQPSSVDIREATCADIGRLRGDERLLVTRDLDVLQNKINVALDHGTERSRVLDRRTGDETGGGYQLDLEFRYARSHTPVSHYGLIDAPFDAAYANMAREVNVHERAAPLPFRAHMYDDVAFVSLDFDDSLQGAHVIRHPGLLEDLHRLFVVLWTRSAPMFEPSVANNALVLVRMLDSGLPDEAAAERLGISLRTYRRRMAELFAALGVNTRFAAGRVAERRGLLDLATVVHLPDARHSSPVAAVP